MNEYHLYIDELGTPDPSDGLSEVYILCGCAVPEYRREELRVKADQIKFKYWGRTDFTFHSREIGNNTGVFSIFENKPELKKEFFKDLLFFLSKSPVIIFSVIIDKALAQTEKWDSESVVRQTAHYLFQNFIGIVISNKNANGKIILESTNAVKDRYYLDAFTYFLSPKPNDLGINFRDVQKYITSISFVTKNNLDIEEQIADLLAYGVKCKYDIYKQKRKFDRSSYESRLINIVNSKSFKMPKDTREFGDEFFSKINSFLLLP
jgi:hypothetical protein